MEKKIIYQVQEIKDKQQNLISNKKKTFFLKRLCSCFSSDIPKMSNVIRPLYIQPETSSPIYNGLRTRKTLVLDLDETLVHSSFQNMEKWDFTIQVYLRYDIQIQIVLQGVLSEVYVSIRPGAQVFIEKLSKYYDIILFTASLKEYANPVIDILDPQKFIVERMFREQCVLVNNQFVKDLKCLKRDLNQVIIIDNNQESFRLQPENAILIKDYVYDKSDRELKKLTSFLIWIDQVIHNKNQFVDVRPVCIKQIEHIAYTDQLFSSLELQHYDEPLVNSPSKTYKTNKMQQCTAPQLTNSFNQNIEFKRGNEFLKLTIANRQSFSKNQKTQSTETKLPVDYGEYGLNSPNKKDSPYFHNLQFTHSNKK